MKKTLIALAALGSFAGVAHAQSTVTLYGIVDAGIAYTNNIANGANSGHAFQMLSGNESGSRWGLTGAEDLGGGLKAIFKLENGFNITNGTASQGGRMFGRQAYVGLSNGSAGTVTLGRQYNPLQDFVAPLDAASILASYATHPLDNDNLNNSFRTDNAVKYTTANFAGFQAEAMYAFSNDTNFANNRSYSVGVSYGQGPLNVAAAYVRANLPNINTGGAIPSDATFSAAQLKNASRMDQWGVGGTYAFGPATVGLLYTGSLFTNAGLLLSNATANSLHFHNFEGSFRYALTPALQLVFAETYTRVSQSGQGGHYLESSLGADYNLSKRTDVYANVFYETTSNNLKANLQGSGSTFSTTNKQVMALVGIRHKF